MEELKNMWELKKIEIFLEKNLLIKQMVTEFLMKF